MNTSHWKQYIFLHFGQTDGASSFPLAPELSNFKLHAKQFLASSLAASFSSCMITGRFVQSGTNSAINFAFTNLEWCDRKKMVIWSSKMRWWNQRKRADAALSRQFLQKCDRVVIFWCSPQILDLLDSPLLSMHIEGIRTLRLAQRKMRLCPVVVFVEIPFQPNLPVDQIGRSGK